MGRNEFGKTFKTLFDIMHTFVLFFVDIGEISKAFKEKIEKLEFLIFEKK